MRRVGATAMSLGLTSADLARTTAVVNLNVSFQADSDCQAATNQGRSRQCDEWSRVTRPPPAPRFGVILRPSRVRRWKATFPAECGASWAVLVGGNDRGAGDEPRPPT